MTVTESRVTRFRRSHPCPICGGGDDMPRGRGQRCSGYLSSDARFAYCTREEHAGRADLEQTEPPTYRHILEGECRCGVTHALGRARSEPLATYDYVDEQGKLLFQVVRLEGKQFRQRRPDGNGDWLWNLNGTRRVLYRLPSVLATAAVGETVYVVEGEKDVHAIERAGGVATCNPGGAEKWKPDYASALEGATVVVVADRDEKGVSHARMVAASLPAAVTTIVQAATGKDAHDHLAAGKTLDEFEPLTDLAPLPDEAPSIVTLYHFIRQEEKVSEAVVGEAGETLLPAGGLVIIGGEGGASKTTLTLDALAHICSGTPWLGFPVDRPVRALIIENEGPRPQFRGKLKAKVESWNGEDFQHNVYVWEEPWASFNFSKQEDRDHLTAFAVDRKIDIVVADPLDSLGIEGAGTPEDTRRFIAHLKDCGLHNTERPLAFWLLHHFNKGLGRSVVQQLSGSWGGHPDTIIGVELGDSQTTKLTWGKLRHATPPKERTLILAWDLETRGFLPIEKPPAVDVEELRQRVLEHVETHPGEAQSSIEDAVGGGRKAVREALEWLASESGSWLLAKGPGRAKNGKYFYPANHAALRSPNGAGEHSGEQQAMLPGSEVLASSPPPVRGGRAFGERFPDATPDVDEEPGPSEDDEP